MVSTKTAALLAFAGLADFGESRVIRVCVCAIVLAICLVSRSAHADNASLSLVYVAPPECPDADAFWSAFVARAHHTTRVTTQATAAQWVMRVRVVHENGLFRASIEIVHDGVTTTREVMDPACATASTALAVIAAVTVEPNPDPLLSPSPSPLPSPSPSPSPSPLPSPSPSPSPSPLPSPWHLRVGGAGVVTSVLSPSFSIGALGYVDLTRDAWRNFEWRVRAGFHYATSLGFEVSGASALVTSYLARLELGGPRVELVHGLEANLGLMVDAGELVGEGRNLSSGRAEPSAWVDLGVLSRLRLDVWHLAIEAGFGAIVPVTRPRFVFQPGPVVVFEPPLIGLIGELGIAARFF